MSLKSLSSEPTQQHHSAGTRRGAISHTINALAEERLPGNNSSPLAASKGNDFIPSWLYLSSTAPGSSIIVFNVTALNFKTTNSTISFLASGVSLARLSRIDKASGGNWFSTKARISASLYSVNAGILSRSVKRFCLSCISLVIIPTFSCLLFFCLSILSCAC